MGTVTEFVGDLKLSEMIDALRVELAVAEDAGRGKALQFEVGPIEIEVEVAVTRTTSGSGGVEFWVVKGGAEHEHANAVTHRIKVSLQPSSADGKGPTKVSRKVSGPPRPAGS